MSRATGHCLCRAVTFEIDAPLNWTIYCHCESCRRATSAPVVTWISVPRAGFRWTGAEPTAFASSPGVQRTFCGRCGSPMSYENDKLPDEIHLFAACLSDPAHVSPTRHVFAGEQLPWFEVHDALPRYRTTMRGAPGPMYVGPR